MGSEIDVLVDSVMGNLKALLQVMSDEAQSLDNQWRERSQELRNNRWDVFGPTDEDERERARLQRACDELYDKAQTVRECMGRVSRKISNIIGENIVIQFSKWNI